jgi:flagellar basal-body rod protein FlgB
LDLFNRESFGFLKNYLNVASIRQKVVAHNIANLNTPGYKRLSVRFEDKLKEALNSEKLPLVTPLKQHLNNQPDWQQVSPSLERDYTTTMRADANNVDLEQEMTLLTANTICYNLAVQRLSDKFEQLSYVITSRGR